MMSLNRTSKQVLLHKDAHTYQKTKNSTYFTYQVQVSIGTLAVILTYKELVKLPEKEIIQSCSSILQNFFFFFQVMPLYKDNTGAKILCCYRKYPLLVERRQNNKTKKRLQINNTTSICTHFLVLVTHQENQHIFPILIIIWKLLLLGKYGFKV